MHGLSVDLEEYFHVSNFEGLWSRGAWDALPSRLEAPTRRLLDRFDECGARATFFVLGWVARRHVPLLREIAARGHEIASHGDCHERVDAMGPGRFRRDLRHARAALEDAIGHTPEGYRAPSFSIGRHSAWALRILAEEGFRYDSSVFPVRHPRYGWPGFPAAPCTLRLGDGLAIEEVPPTTLGVGPLRLPIAGGAYLRFLPGPLFRWAWRRATAGGRTGVLYVHPWELDPEQPRQDVGLRIRVNHYHGLARTEERLDRLLVAHRFTPLAALLDRLRAQGRLASHWIARAPRASGWRGWHDSPALGS